MLRTLLILPDGREVFSGKPGPAVVRARLSRNVNKEENIAPGTVCPDLLECTLAEAQSLGLQPGQEVTVYHVDDENIRHLQGIFILQTVVSTDKALQITAKDRLSLLEQDLTALLLTEDFWPCTAQQLVAAVCQRCGLEANTQDLPMEQLKLSGCGGRRVTGTKLMSWLAKLLGVYCRADAQGRLCFDWFAPADLWLSVTDSGVVVREGILRTLDPCTAQAVDGGVVFAGMGMTVQDTRLHLQPQPTVPVTCRLSGDLQVAAFETRPVQQVVLKTGEKDPGAVYPQIPEGDNAYILQDDPLLQGVDPVQREQVAQQLYERLQLPAYTPCTLRLRADPRIQIGTVVRQQNDAGESSCFYVMQQIIEGSTMLLRCTGTRDRKRDSVLPDDDFGQLEHTVVELSADLDGLVARLADGEGNTTALSVQLGNIESKVTAQMQTAAGLQEHMTRLQQQEDQLFLQVRAVQEEGASRVVTTTGYRFDDEGLHIKKAGQAMENQLDYTGMYVKRSGTPVLVANSDGVTAVGVTVKDYLYVGDYARLEDYSNGEDGCRTACFFTGG